MRELRAEGFRISVWVFNFVEPNLENSHYVEGLRNGYFAKDAGGCVWKDPAPVKGIWSQHAVIDFSNPEACRWFAAKIKDLIRLGAAVIKTDFAEGIPEDARYRNISGRRFHNLYALAYNACVSRAVKELNGEGLVWGRSGTAGSQRYPVQWGGDPFATFQGLAGSIRGMLAMGLSGIPFSSHDIGGFFGRPTPELYVRWAQVGMFSSHARAHGQGKDNCREPWTFGAKACRIFRDYARLRYRLLPEICSLAQQASETGLPLVRHMIFEFPDDPNVRHLEDQYMFGPSLLIAPVLQPLAMTRERRLYLPRGEWFDYWTKKKIQSTGEWIIRRVDLKTMPIYVRSGSVLCYTAAGRQHTQDSSGPILLCELYGRAFITGLRHDPEMRHYR
jgi:alpha-D-xyloside xylohydrolase